MFCHHAKRAPKKSGYDMKTKPVQVQPKMATCLIIVGCVLSPDGIDCQAMQISHVEEISSKIQQQRS
jgi:hypothetical protein